MKVQVLASSSAGNCTYVELGDKKFLIDVGLTFASTIEKLSNIGVTPEEIDFILITHAHSDHVKSLYAFNRKFNTKLYISNETYDELDVKDKIKEYFPVEELENIDDIKVIKVPISHDKKGFGYVLECGEDSLVYITDTGMIHQKYHKYLMNKKVYVFESNHDVDMVMYGTKNYVTKIRNIGDSGHLSNNDCAKYLSMFVGDKTKIVFLAHISEHDNDYELAYKTNREVINKKINVILTDKVNSTGLIEV